MNYLKIGLITLSCALLGVSCTKQLNQTPQTDKVLSNFFNSENEAEEYINAVYAQLQAKGLYGQYLPGIAEIASDNTFDQVPANDNGWYGQLDLFTTIPSNGILSENWKASYIAIQRANVVLHRIDAIAYQDETRKTARKGAMKFVRALIYFNLVRTYGDVPLVTTETTDPNAYFGQGRTAQTAVYEQILTDLNEAIQELPLTADQIGGLRKTAAQALLGKVLLTLGRPADAALVLTDLVQSGQHELLSDPAAVFALSNEQNQEIIFAVQFASGVNGNSEGSGMQQQFSPSGFVSGAKGHNLPNLSLYQLYADTDLRKGVYVDTTTKGVPYCRKYTAPTTTPSDGGSDFVVLRYADVLLMLAEAVNASGQTETARYYLNKVHVRAGLDSLDLTGSAAIAQAIAVERRLELIGEGHRWYDLLRSGHAIQTMNDWFAGQSSPIRIDEHNLLMPIPQGQVDTDPAIRQNAGY